LRVLITGADGFVGKNLRLYLSERKDIQVVTYTRKNSNADFPTLLKDVSCVVHLAGTNRTQNAAEFQTGNTELTAQICDAVAHRAIISPIKFILASSIQAERDNAYGQSKRGAEDAVFSAGNAGRIIPFVFRLPNVFGKWCRPNYNSAVATFCYNTARDLPIAVNDPSATLTLVYVDDVISTFMKIIDSETPATKPGTFVEVETIYKTTVGEVASLIQTFHQDRKQLKIEHVGAGLARALYATYVSYLPADHFAYPVIRHADNRGVFVEMLKTPSSGQFSYFTAKPGITRGGHYHHTKTEKFLVIQGNARFLFRNMDTGETAELLTNGQEAQIVDTAPGWAHDITNVGQDELIVMLWANEIFDRDLPDTYACALGE
jgi:UDP-2-acetamido-2,6-beta-L-arabino-hexul-4-ose reductase